MSWRPGSVQNVLERLGVDMLCLPQRLFKGSAYGWVGARDKTVAEFVILWRRVNARLDDDLADAGHDIGQIGRAHVLTPVTNSHLVCRLLIEKKNTRNNHRS